jgi:hypothetical protein
MRMLILVSVIGLSAHAKPKQRQKPSEESVLGGGDSLASIFAATECANMPASLNPWGKRCAKEVAKRWSACDEAHRDHPAALLDCLGFKRPPPATQGFQESMLRKWALDECASLAERAPPGDCRQVVSERFERCGPPAITKEIDSKALLSCLGFRVPE